MKNDFLTSGRKEQKLKTRQLILETAHKMMASESQITLESVAQASGVSRATIYRYFPSASILLTEAAISIKTKLSTVLVEETAGMDLLGSLEYAQNYYNALALNNEVAFRKFLSEAILDNKSKKPGSPTRGGRRPATAEVIVKSKGQALNEQDQKNLIQIFTLLCGIEAVIANKDVNRMNSKDSNELLNWALRVIVNGVSN